MKHSLRLIVSLTVCCTLFKFTTTADAKNSSTPELKKRIVCKYNTASYYKTHFTPDMIDPTLCTHINYEFASLNPKTHLITAGDEVLDIQQGFYGKVKALKNVNPNLKVLIGLGGWKDSTKKYSMLVADAKERKAFKDNVISFIKQHGFDGLDVAWEYPNCWQGACGVSPRDKRNYVAFLKELRDAFKPLSLLLSASVASLRKEIITAYDVPNVAALLDYINVLTFDLHGPWEHVTGHHAQFASRAVDKNPEMNMQTSLSTWVEFGAPKEKINMGIPAYGRTYTLASALVKGVDAPAISVGKPGQRTQEGGYLAYHEICEYLNGDGWNEEEDPNAGTYAHNGNQWVSYDSQKQVVVKARYAAENGYGGVLFKDVGSDDYQGSCFSVKYPLLRAIKLELIRRTDFAGDEEDPKTADSDY